jgi:hypothetical protein
VWKRKDLALFRMSSDASFVIILGPDTLTLWGAASVVITALKHSTLNPRA